MTFEIGPGSDLCRIFKHPAKFSALQVAFSKYPQNYLSPKEVVQLQNHTLVQNYTTELRRRDCQLGGLRRRLTYYSNKFSDNLNLP